MKTISFYSYKGGVGRTLALVNIANRLAEFGKKVCIIDFDLEAPGLDCKYKKYVKNATIKKGFVDYIYEFAINDRVSNIGEYSLEFFLPNAKESIHFFPAGNTDSGDYWTKLSKINWWNLLYEKESNGIEFFLHTKQQIEKIIDPDYLLIDNRTGITEMSSLTLSLLADRVVVLAANNEENLLGSERIIRSLTNPENNLLKIDREIHFVLTRVPISVDPDENSRISVIAKQKISRIQQVSKKNNQELSSTHIIHSDRRIEENEQEGLYVDYNYSTTQLDSEYSDLYNSLTHNDFSDLEKEVFERNKIFQKKFSELVKMYLKDDIAFYDTSTQLLEEYKEDHIKNTEIRKIRAFFYLNNDRYNDAIRECDLVLEADSDQEEFKLIKTRALFSIRKYKEAYNLIEDISVFAPQDRLLKIRIKWYAEERNEGLINETLNNLDSLINEYPQKVDFLNEKACCLRSLSRYNEALECIYKALELDTEVGCLYSTLAEIKYLQGDFNEFYRNVELALKYNFKLKDVIQDEVISLYKEIIHEERFQNIIKKYNQDSLIELIANSDPSKVTW